MENLSMLKKMVCLLSCQPRNMTLQLPAALYCLRVSVDAQAVGIYWRDVNDRWIPRAQRPTRFCLDDATRQAIEECGDIAHPTWGQTKISWLVAPMKVGGAPLGRLWVVAERGDDPQVRGDAVRGVLLGLVAAAGQGFGAIRELFRDRASRN